MYQKYKGAELCGAKLKDYIRNRLTNDQIYILGYGAHARRFAVKIKDEVHIAGFLTDVEDYKEVIECGGVTYPVYHLADFAIKDNQYVILATKYNGYMDTAVMALNWPVYESYIWSGWYDAFMHNKKIMLISGNCQIGTAYYYLSELQVIKQNYILIVQLIHLYDSRYARKIWKYLLRICDVYICGIHQKKDPKYFKEYEIPGDCRVIMVPSMVFSLYWPQIMLNDERQVTINDKYIAAKEFIKKQSHGPFECGDKNINFLMDQGKRADEIVEILSDDAFYSKEEIRNRLVCLDELSVMDRECDLHFYDYINQNWKKKLIFNDPVHMSVDFNWYVCRQIIRYLELEESELDCLDVNQFSKQMKGFMNHCTIVPIYPCVAKHLGLEWYQGEKTTYEVTFYNGLQHLTFAEYIHKYVEVCGLIEKLKGTW